MSREKERDNLIGKKRKEKKGKDKRMGVRVQGAFQNLI
jgi:hypothetical protein